MSKKYDTFAAYLEDVYYNQIFSKNKSYLYNNQGRLYLSTSAVPDPSYVELSDYKIMGVNFHESDTDKIECKVTVRAEIEISGRGRRGLRERFNRVLALDSLCRNFEKWAPTS